MKFQGTIGRPGQWKAGCYNSHVAIRNPGNQFSGFFELIVNMYIYKSIYLYNMNMCVIVRVCVLLCVLLGDQSELQVLIHLTFCMKP